MSFYSDLWKYFFCRPVSREEIEIHRPLFLKKSRKLEGFHFKNRDFIDFSYKFLTRRFSLTLYKQEKYYCMEALLSVLELMNYEQHDKLLCCAEPEEYVWRADQLVQIMVTLLKQHPMYCQMFAVQTLSYLAYAHGLSYEKIFDVYGIGILLKKFSEEKVSLYGIDYFYIFGEVFSSQFVEILVYKICCTNTNKYSRKYICRASSQSC